MNERTNRRNHNRAARPRARLVLSRAALALALAAGLGTQVEVRQSQPSPAYEVQGFLPHQDYYSPLPFEYIDPLRGNVLLTFTDLSLPGNGGFNLDFVRTFNHHGSLWRFGVAGVPMTVSPAVPLYDDNQDEWSLPRFTTVDGAVHQSVWPTGTDGGDEVITKEFWLYEFDEPNHLRLNLPNGLTAEYNLVQSNPPAWSVGYVTEIADRFGNTVSLSWSPDLAGPKATLTSVTQNLGAGETRTITFDYEGSSNTDWPRYMHYGSRTWTYTYENEACDPICGELTEALPPAGEPWEYAYTGSADGTMTVTTPQGGTVGYTFELQELESDVYGSMPTIRSTDGPDVTGGTWTFAWTYHGSSVFGPVNRVEYEYDLYSRQVGPVQDSRTVKDLQGNVIQTESLDFEDVYLSGRASAEYATARLTDRTIQRGESTYTTSYGYSANDYGDYGHPNSIDETGELARHTAVTYKEDFGPYIRAKVTGATVTVDGDSFSSSYAYNATTGFMQSATVYGVFTTFESDGLGNVSKRTDANGHDTRYNFDWGALKDTTRPKGDVIARTINSDGTVASEARNGVTTSYSYDDVGRETLVHVGVGNTQIGDDTATAYNDGARTMTVTRGASQVVTSYDGFGRAIGTNDAVGVTTSTSYDAEGRKTHQTYPVENGSLGEDFGYDALGRVTSVTHPAGAVGYDFSGNTVTISDELSRDTVQHWEAFGNPDDRRLARVDDANGTTWYYSYNAVGSLTRVAPQDGAQRTWSYDTHNFLTDESQPESGSTTYGRDSVGNMSARTDSRGTFTYTYDDNDRLTAIDAPGTTEDESFVYDDADNQTRALHGVIDLHRTFYGNRLSQETLSVGGHDFTVAYDYDGRDNVIEVSYPTDREIVYAYDSGNRITGVTDHDGHTFASQVAHHPSGAVSFLEFGNNLTATTGFDDRYRPQDLTSGPLNLTYGYDGAGNVTSITDNERGLAFSSGYGYDSLDRLTSVTGFGSNGFTYDPYGNRTYGGGNSYTYDNATQRLTHVSGSGPESGNYGYDNAGDLTSDPSGTYTYSIFNMLASATVGGQTTTYEYDADNQRVVKAAADGTHYYVHGPGGQLLVEYLEASPDPVVVREYVYLGSQLLASLGVAQPAPPALSVAITSPENNDSFQSGSTVTLQASVTGSDIARVEYYNGGIYIGQATSAPYAVNWTNTPLPPGSFTFFARVVTTANDVAVSEPVTITMTSAPALAAEHLPARGRDGPAPGRPQPVFRVPGERR